MSNVDLARKKSYILWLLRDKGIIDWSGLCKYFGWDPSNEHTGTFFLHESLESLKEAKLITINKRSGQIKVTELLQSIQTTLEISLKELAIREEHESLLVNPIFGRPNHEDYGSDVFVLMPFLEDLKPVYDDHIKKVVESLSMSVTRSDDFFSAFSIIEEICSAIYFSKSIIADCTGRNPNVFYEIGLAHTLGKNVVLITQNENDVPFDLRYRRYIKYDYTPRGMESFEKILLETLRNIDSA